MTDILERPLAPPGRPVTPLVVRRRRVVVVTYHYPPDHAVGGLRPARLARALAAEGCEVRIITAERAGDTREQLSRGQSIQVRPVRMQPSPRAALIQIRNEFRGHAPEATAEESWAADSPDRLEESTWKRRLLSLLWLPDDLQGFIVPAARAVLDEVRQGCDLIYTSGPPFSTHLAGWLARTISGVPWFAEFRDPWTDNPGKPEFVRSTLSDSIEQWLERQVLHRADGVVAVTPETGRLLADKMPAGRRDRVLVALSGIERMRVSPPVQRTGPIRIVYTGNLYLGRDPRPFLQGLAEARRQVGFGADAVRVDFVGDCRLFKGASVKVMADQLGVGDLVHFVPWASPDHCRTLQENADLLLLLAEGQPLQIPNKLYEYLGTRRPILAFVDAGGEAARMLAEVGGHVLVTNPALARTTDAILASLEHAKDRRPRGDTSILQSWSSDTQMRALIAWIGARR